MIEKLSLYRSFTEVAERGSISAAARALFVTQPAVSADIKELEQRLGVPLFSRTNRGIRLTPQGQTLLAFVRKAFDSLALGEAALADVTALRGGVLRIGASDMTLRCFLLDHLATFRGMYPGVKLRVTNNPTPKTLTALRAGELDFGVISGPAGGLPSEKDLVLVPVREIRDIFVTTPTHPLASEREISVERLASTPLVMLEKETGTRQYLATLTGFCDLVPDIELATSDLIVAFAERGLACACVVEDFAKEAIAAGRLCALSLAAPPPPRQLHIVYRRDLPISAAARALFAQIGIAQPQTKQQGENRS